MSLVQQSVGKDGWRHKKNRTAGGTKRPPHRTPWPEIRRGMVDQLGSGVVLKAAIACQRVAETKGLPWDNH